MSETPRKLRELRGDHTPDFCAGYLAAQLPKWRPQTGSVSGAWNRGYDAYVQDLKSKHESCQHRQRTEKELCNTFHACNGCEFE